MGKLLTPAAITAALIAIGAAPAAADRSQRVDRLERGLERVVNARGGPPGASAVLYRHGRERLIGTGVADVETGRPFRRQKLMRIASAAKAFSGAVALSLVDDGRLSLDDTIGAWLPELPAAWSSVTLRQLLGHTSGLPDFSDDERFIKTFIASPRRTNVQMLELVDFVRHEPLQFAPGSNYRYSNTDNIVVALIAEAATGVSYRRLLQRRVARPLGLENTDLPRGFRLPRPNIRGYDTLPEIEDLTDCCAAAWSSASGGVTSTPHDLARFVRGYVGGELFARGAQFDFVRGGRSDPPGPGRMSAGLALFRYRTRCGTVYGHTGNTFGYTQFMAATANGRRAVVVSINRQLTPKTPGRAGRAFPALRASYRLAVCALLR